MYFFQAVFFRHFISHHVKKKRKQRVKIRQEKRIKRQFQLLGNMKYILIPIKLHDRLVCNRSQKVCVVFFLVYVCCFLLSFVSLFFAFFSYLILLRLLSTVSLHRNAKLSQCEISLQKYTQTFRHNLTKISSFKKCEQRKREVFFFISVQRGDF